MERMSEDDLRKTLVDLMKRTGTSPDLIFAFEKTGFLLTEDNAHQFTAADLEEWNAAIAEYERQAKRE